MKGLRKVLIDFYSFFQLLLKYIQGYIKSEKKIYFFKYIRNNNLD